MALGHALMAFASLFPQESRCDFQVLAGRSERPSQYLQLADLYRRSDRTEAVRRLGDLDRLAVAEVLARLEKLRGNLEVLPPDDDRLHAASMMEMELGLALALDSRWQEADFHLDSAWKVSVEMKATEREQRFQRDFLLATGLFLHERIFLSDPEAAFGRAETFLREAVRRYPRDPEVVLATGALLEWSGSLPEGERSQLKEAAELYALCLQLVPEDREALLRQGWVLQKLGRNAEAEAALRKLLALGAGDILIYRARMGPGKAGRRGRPL